MLMFGMICLMFLLGIALRDNTCSFLSVSHIEYVPVIGVMLV